MRRLLLGSGLVLVVATGITGLAGRAALSAAGDLERAQERLRSVQDTDTTPEAAVAALRRAGEDVDRASETLGSWPVDVLAAVPVLGRSWDAERAVAQTARHVIDGAVVVADRLPGVRAAAGGVDLSALAAVSDELVGPVRRSEAALAELEAVPVGLTPPQAANGVQDAVAALGPAVDLLADAESGLQVVSGLLGGDGPRTLLVMLQNNAELRGAGGYAASFATGRVEDGRLTLGPLQDVVDVADPPSGAERVPAPEEYLEDFEHLSANTTIWRSWNMSPHVPDSALVGARVAAELLPQPPDVVVLLDVPALGALADLGGGGVTLPDGSTVSSEALTEALLVEAYADAGSDGAAQVQRRAELQAAATAAVSRLLAGGVPVSEAGRTLGRLAAQRHLSVWSARPEEQAVLEDLGLGGAVQPPDGGDLSHVSVNNVGGNKLDYYVARDLEVDVVLGEDEAGVVQRVTFTNEAPADLVPYVAGNERPGVVVSLVELSLPPLAEGLAATVDGQPWRGALHEGAVRDRLSTVIHVPRGASSVLEVRYTLPVDGGGYRLRLVPQPLVADADLALSVQAAEGERLGAVDGAAETDGVARVRGPFSQTVDVSITLEQETRSRWERLSDWWSSPVEIG